MTGRSVLRLGLLLACAAPLSCQVIYGLDAFETGLGDGAGGGATASGSGGATTAASSTTTTTSGDPTECGASAACVEPIPAGWDGYFQLLTTASDQPPAECADMSAPVTYLSGPPSAPASCSACTCGNLAASCPSATLECFFNNSCTIGSGGITYNDGDCGTVPIGSSHCKQGPQPPATASCPPSAVTPTIDTAWEAAQSLCPAQAGEPRCGSDGQCVPSASLVCIRRAADVAACPTGWESAQRITAYTGATDTRGCSACSCAPPAVSCSGGGYHFHGGILCTGGITDLVEGACTGVGTGIVSYSGAVPGGGSCTPEGGQPEGALTPEGAVTLCCKAPG